MSRNFSWFLRIMIYIPLAISLVVVLGYSYLSGRFDKNIQACMQTMSVLPSPADRKAIVPFVGCLKKKSNFFLTKAMNEDRLYQYAYPKLPCYFVGKWHVSAPYREYWLTIEPNANVRMEKIPDKSGQEQKDSRVRTGIWSAERDKVLQFPDDASFWTLNESKLNIFDAKHFMLTDNLDEPTYYYRHSEIAADCPTSP